MSLKVNLSKHNIEVRHISLDTNMSEIALEQIKGDVLDWNILNESARISRGSKDLIDISKLKISGCKALIIPSFTTYYSKYWVDKLHNLASVRSSIKEFHI